MIKYALTGLLCFSSFIGICQQDRSLSQLLNELSQMLREVDVGKDNYLQKLTYQAEKPYKVIFKTILTDSKGRSEEYIFELNLADIDENLVRWESSKKQIEVNLKTERSAKTIKVIEDGAQQNYDNEFSVLAIDIDNARKIEEQLKVIIPKAQKLWEDEGVPVVLDDMDAMQNWLMKNIETIEIGDEYIHQQIEFLDGKPDMLQFSMEEVDSKGEKEQTDFRFSLGDINEASVNLDVKGKQLFVECSTHRKSNFIQVMENGELKNYEDKVQFFANDVDQARIFLLVLQKLIPLCKARQEKQLERLVQGNAFAIFIKEIRPFKDDKNQYEQQILNNECITTYSLSKSNDRNNDQYLYKFNFADLNDRDIDIKISGIEISVPLSANKSYNETRLIQHYKNGELQNYQDDFELFFPSIESAKIALYVLPSIINDCEAIVETENFSWLATQVQKKEGITPGIIQTLEVQFDTPCKYVFTTIESGKKDSKESVFEFNLYDLDPDKLELEVKGKDVKLIANTIHKEVIIKVYEEGEASYTDNIEVLLPDVEIAKKAIETLKKLIQDCKK